MAATIQDINEQGFVRFEHRDMGWRGNKHTWARYNAETRELTLNLSQNGGINSEFLDELREFCAAYGIDYNSMRRGDRETITLPEHAVQTKTAEACDTHKIEDDMQITIENNFHGTSIQLTPVEIYKLESGQPCAVLSYDDYMRASKALCGMSSCTCGKVPGNGLGDNGIRYALAFREFK